MSLSTLTMIFIVFGLLLSLNPITIAIFTGLLAGGYGKRSSRGHVHATALAYLLVLFSIFAISGAIWVHFLYAIDLQALHRISFVVATLCIIWGTISLKDFYWYTPRSSAPAFATKSVHKRTMKQHEPIGAGILAITTSYVVSLSMGLPFIALATFSVLLQGDSLNGILLLSAMLLLPLISIFVLSLRKLRLSAVMKWRQDSRMVFRLCIGLATILIGWLLLLVLNGTIGTNL